MTTANGQPIIEARIGMPVVGNWHARLDCSAQAGQALSGQVTIESDGITFIGTVLPNRGGLSGSRSRAKVAGGAGGLTTTLEARNYSSGVAIAAIVADILREAGETLSGDSDQTILARLLPKWERLEAPASRCLFAVLARVGAIWRMQRDGTVLVTTEQYPEATVPHVVLDEEWAEGKILIRPEAPDLLPGVTFLGQQIRFVRHVISRGGLRTEAWLDSPSGMLNRFLAGLRREVDNTTPWPCRVVKQNPDGTLELQPDDQQLRGAGGLNRVPIRHGLPGVTGVSVPKGTRLRVHWDARDGGRPYAALWDEGLVDEIVFANGTSAVARVGSAVQCYFGPAIPVSGTVSGAPFAGVMTIATPALGIVIDGWQGMKVP